MFKFPQHICIIIYINIYMDIYMGEGTFPEKGKLFFRNCFWPDLVPLQSPPGFAIMWL